MKKEIKELSDRAIITKSNSMISAKYALDALEQKIILLAICQIDSVNDEKFCKFSCSISELQERIGVELNYSRFRTFAKNILKKPLEIYEPETDEYIACNWFSAFKYKIKQGIIEFEMSPTLIPYLLQLKSNFSHYNIENVIKFNGKYSFRFYELAIQMRNQKNKQAFFNLDELYEIFQLPTSLRDYSKFKIKVLEPALNEINEISDIVIKYEPTKKIGKRITEISIKMNFKEQLAKQTETARVKQAYSKYKDKVLLYYDNLYRIESVADNSYRTDCKIMAIVRNYDCISKKIGDDISRADFFDLNDLELAIQKGKAEVEYRRANKDKYQRQDKTEQVTNLFNQLFKETK